MINSILLVIIVTILVSVFFYFKPPNKAQAEKLYEEYEKWKAYCDVNRCDIAKVYRVRQATKNGTKAYVKWLTRDGSDAVWIKTSNVSSGQIFVLQGNYGHGSHHKETVYYVNSFEVLPRKIIRGWKLHKATLDAEASTISANKKIIERLLSAILSDPELSLPLYCDFIRSEDDANNLQDILPLVYIWNEDKVSGTFSVSINGSIVGSLLETLIPRSHDNFNVIRDTALYAIRDNSLAAILKICEKAGALPSVIFGLNDRKEG